MLKKEIAIHFLELASKGKSREAFQLYTSKKFIHHNAYFKGDATTLMEAMEEDAKKNPTKVFEILRVLEDGNLVAVHSRYQHFENNLEMAIMHIFQFENTKITELWDFGQAVPKNMVNENGMF